MFNLSHNISSDLFTPVMILLVAWTLFWKSLGLWHAARKGRGGWFVLLFLFNTAGILDIIFIFGVAKIDSDKLFK